MSSAASRMSVEPRGRVLVVDDEPLVAKAVRRVLAPHHEVVLAGDADAAAAALRDGDFDLVLCDVAMPGRSGVELHRDLATARPALAARFVFLTGGVASEEVSRYLEACGAAQVTKPFEPAALRALAAERVASPRAG